MSVIHHLISLDEDKAAEAMEIFEELFETELPLVRAHFLHPTPYFVFLVNVSRLKVIFQTDQDPYCSSF